MRVGFLVLFSALALIAAPASAQEGTVRIPSVGPSGVATLPAATELTRTCWIADVGAFSNRVHVRCKQETGPALGGLYSRDYAPPPEADAGVIYFAVGAASDPALADRVIALASSASQQNKQIQIFYRTNPAENPPGCQPNDCRRLTGLVMLIQ